MKLGRWIPSYYWLLISNVISCCLYNLLIFKIFDWSSSTACLFELSQSGLTETGDNISVALDINSCGHKDGNAAAGFVAVQPVLRVLKSHHWIRSCVASLPDCIWSPMVLNGTIWSLGAWQEHNLSVWWRQGSYDELGKENSVWLRVIYSKFYQM